MKEEKGLNNGAGVSAENSLIEGLKMVIHSRGLENKMPVLKDTILTAQQVEAPRLPPTVPEHRPLKSALKPALKPAALTAPIPAPLTVYTTTTAQGSAQGHAPDNALLSMFSDNDSLLPHERGGSDFSWIQTQTQEDFLKQKATEVEDEESFLYGNDEPTSSHSATSHPTSLPPSYSCPRLDGAEFDKIKNILKSISANSTEAKAKPQVTAPPADCNTAHALPALNNPNVRQALESLQSLIKATKEKRAQEKGDREGSVSSQSSGRRMNAEDKKACKTKIELLMKELEGLMKQDGLGFLTPVIGFYCHKCEEFIGDLNTAEKHAAVHRSSAKPQGDKRSGDGKSHQKKESKKCKEKKPPPPPPPPPTNPTNLYLKEKLQEERMLITVSCGAEAVANSSHKRERESSSSSSKEERGNKPHKKKKKKHKKNKKKK